MVSVRTENGLGSERGAIMMLLAILLPSIMFLLSLTINSGYSSIIRAELQSAADAASLAGSQSFDGTQAGWEAARNNAIYTINEFGLHGRIGEYTNVNLDPSDMQPDSTNSPSTVQRTVWTDNNLTISIRRGRWDPVAKQFVSMEDELSSDDSIVSGQTANGNSGLPRYAIAHAVEVVVRRDDVGMLIPLEALNSFAVERHSIALAGPMSEQRIAPFAVPICSVVDSSGNFMAPPKDGSGNVIPQASPLCAGDRLFTKANGYHDSADATIVPDFAFVPQYRGGGTGYAGAISGQCDFANFKYDDRQDHFGVVGLPNVASVSEDLIRSTVGAGNGDAIGKMGDPFNILYEGLTGDGGTSDATNDTVFARISGPNPSTPSGPNAAYSATDLEALIETGTNYKSTSPAPRCQTKPNRTHGLCNSMRYGFPQTSGSCSKVWYNYNSDNPTLKVDFPVWTTHVPVIADVGADAAPCAGTVSAGVPATDAPITDPSVTPSEDHQWVIVGFLSANIFDTDINRAPPTDIGCHPSPSALLTWGFSEDGVNPVSSCNLVRARINCNSEFISSSEDMGARTPMLTDPSV